MYPRCKVCRVPQYTDKLLGHEAYCTTPPYTGRGRPRTYPIGQKVDTYGKYLKHRHPHTHGGARRGEAWEWARTGEEVIRGRKDGRREETKEEVYPIRYICALLKISRPTLYIYCRRLQIPMVKTTGPGQHKAALTVQGIQALLAYLHH